MGKTSRSRDTYIGGKEKTQRIRLWGESCYWKVALRFFRGAVTMFYFLTSVIGRYVCSLCVQLYICLMHVSVSTLYFIIKKPQLPPNWNCRKQLTTQITCLRFCDLITKVQGWTLVLNENITPTTYSLQFKVRRIHKGNQS